MEDFSVSPAVIWASLGIALCVAEILTGTFVLLFFGLAAFVVSIASAFGLESLSAQIMVFAAAGLAATLLFRRKLAQAMTKDQSSGFSADRDQVITVSEDVPAHGEAMIMYQGSMWTAVNPSSAPITKGTKARIEKTEGVRIFIRAI